MSDLDINNSVMFSVYRLPNGERTEQLCGPFSSEVVAKAAVITEAKFVFEFEVLSTGMASYSIGDREAEIDISILLVPPGTTESENLDKVATWIKEFNLPQVIDSRAHDYDDHGVEEAYEDDDYTDDDDDTVEDL